MKRYLSTLFFFLTMPIVLLFECMDFYRKTDPGFTKMKTSLNRPVAESPLTNL